MKKEIGIARAPWVGALALALVLGATSAHGQAPDDTTFTGRLVNGAGVPLAGPVNLELRIFDDETSGTQLYSEDHLGVSLDPTGGFSVQLGLGTSPSGPFDADLFSEPDRWLEVVVGIEVLTPRQRIGSVPWALISRQANELVPDPAAPRFEDCGNGTVADHKTGLLWERKTGSPSGAKVLCESVDCPDPHVVNNSYFFATSVTTRDGGAFYDFLARLNGEFVADGPGQACFVDRCDWRLPSIAELKTILIGPEAAPGQALTCSAGPCIDPAFAAVGGPTKNGPYWATRVENPGNLGANFQNGLVFFYSLTFENYVRAVRTGACH